jgi:hypothetical protein
MIMYGFTTAKSSETRSMHEDQENHFHLCWYAPVFMCNTVDARGDSLYAETAAERLGAYRTTMGSCDAEMIKRSL